MIERIGGPFPSAEAFMRAKHDPKWKPPTRAKNLAGLNRVAARAAVTFWAGRQPGPADVLGRALIGGVKPLGKTAEDKALAARFQYSRGHDYRTIREPVSLDEFIERKSIPGWKPGKIPQVLHGANGREPGLLPLFERGSGGWKLAS